jgi:hypothetical protein
MAGRPAGPRTRALQPTDAYFSLDATRPLPLPAARHLWVMAPGQVERQQTRRREPRRARRRGRLGTVRATAAPWERTKPDDTSPRTMRLPWLTARPGRQAADIDMDDRHAIHLHGRRERTDKSPILGHSPPTASGYEISGYIRILRSTVEWNSISSSFRARVSHCMHHESAVPGTNIATLPYFICGVYNLSMEWNNLTQTPVRNGNLNRG